MIELISDYANSFAICAMGRNSRSGVCWNVSTKGAATRFSASCRCTIFAAVSCVLSMDSFGFGLNLEQQRAVCCY
jgi:hypothetical protein